MSTDTKDMSTVKKGHIQDDLAKGKVKLKGKAGKKANPRGLQGDEKIGGRLKESAEKAG